MQKVAIIISRNIKNTIAALQKTVASGDMTDAIEKFSADDISAEDLISAQNSVFGFDLSAFLKSLATGVSLINLMYNKVSFSIHYNTLCSDLTTKDDNVTKITELAITLYHKLNKTLKIHEEQTQEPPSLPTKNTQAAENMLAESCDIKQTQNAPHFELECININLDQAAENMLAESCDIKQTQNAPHFELECINITLDNAVSFTNAQSFMSLTRAIMSTECVNMVVALNMDRPTHIIASPHIIGVNNTLSWSDKQSMIHAAQDATDEDEQSMFNLFQAYQIISDRSDNLATNGSTENIRFECIGNNCDPDSSYLTLDGIEKVQQATHIAMRDRFEPDPW